MKRKANLPLLAWVCCLAVMFACMAVANAYQTDFGKIEVTRGAFATDDGNVITYKLYRPVTATAETPAPAVLLMHGYQNDKDTSSSYALELARRGIVALSIDEYGHGGTSIGMLARGYTYHKLPNWDKSVSGPERFLLMMNFNTSDFFTNLADVPGDTLGDTSMGGRTMYAYLSTLPFVDAENMGVTGHSMGTWSSWSVAATDPSVKAIVLQCGELFPQSYYDNEAIHFNNVLLIQSRYDEFTSFLDYTKAVPDDLVNTELRYKEFAGQDGPIEWNTTYGSFADGTARRMELITNANHRLVTINNHAIATTLDWFETAFQMDSSIASTSQTALIKETFLFLGTLAALASVLPLLLLLLKTKFFAPCAQPMPDRAETLLPRKKWWGAALTAILISGLSYPFITQLGHGLVPLPENIFRMTIGDGVITWFVFLALVAFFMLRHWFKRGAGKKAGETLYDLGCGDGRILLSAARNFGARAVGVELSPTLVKRAQQMVDSQGLQDQVKVQQGDMMQIDVSPANVVALYLMTDANEQLRPKLERELKPGARVVSLEFKIKGWKPARVEKVEAHRHPYTIYVYELPQK